MKIPPSIIPQKPSLENKTKAQTFGKILCRIGIHKPTQKHYIDSHGGDDGICGCERCGRVLG